MHENLKGITDRFEDLFFFFFEFSEPFFSVIHLQQ